MQCGRPINLVVQGDFNTAVKVMRDHAEVVTHVRCLLTNMGYWPGLPTEAKPTATPSATSTPSSSPAVDELSPATVSPCKKPASSRDTAVARGGRVAVVGADVLGQKARMARTKESIPDAIHRNYSCWKDVGSNVLKFLLSQVMPIVCSQHNLKAVCSANQKDPPRDKILELFEFYCNRDPNSPVGPERAVSALAETFQDNWKQRGCYGSDLRLPADWLAQGWYTPEVLSKTMVRMFMLTCDEPVDIPVELEDDAIAAGFPKVEQNFSIHRARLMLHESDYEPVFCTSFFTVKLAEKALKRKSSMLALPPIPSSMPSAKVPRLGLQRFGSGSDLESPATPSRGMMALQDVPRPSARPTSSPNVLALTTDVPAAMTPLTPTSSVYGGSAPGSATKYSPTTPGEGLTSDTAEDVQKTTPAKVPRKLSTPKSKAKVDKAKPPALPHATLHKFFRHADDTSQGADEVLTAAVADEEQVSVDELFGGSDGDDHEDHEDNDEDSDEEPPPPEE